MEYFLDTSVAIALRDGDVRVRRVVGALDGSGLLSTISQVELEGGVHRDPALAPARRKSLELLLARLTIVSFDERAARAYGEIVRVAGYSRRKLLDRMIGAQARVHEVTLVTANPSDFADIPGLDLLPV